MPEPLETTNKAGPSRVDNDRPCTAAFRSQLIGPTAEQFCFPYRSNRVRLYSLPARGDHGGVGRFVLRWEQFTGVVQRMLVVMAGILSISGATAGLAQDAPPTSEMWSGAQVTENSFYAYSGFEYALGNDIVADGWRLRLTAGGGDYSYLGRLPLQPIDSADIAFQGTSAMGDVAIGYQQRFNSVIAEAFLGASYVDHRIVPWDVLNPVSGREFGAVAAVNLWIDLDAAMWASLGGSYDTAFSGYSAYASAGYRILPDLSLGIEAGAFGNASLDASRFGSLVKWDTAYGELTAAGGVSGDYEDPSTPYGRVSWLVRF